MSISLRRSATSSIILSACLITAALIGRSAAAADAARKPIAAKPQMRLFVGPRQLSTLLQTEIVQTELTLKPEQLRKLAEVRLRWLAWSAPQLGKDPTNEALFAFHRELDAKQEEHFVGIERVLTPAQHGRLDEITLQLYLPYTFYAGLGLELDDHLRLTTLQRKRTYRYAQDHCNLVCAMYDGRDRFDREDWDRHRAEERVWRAALLAELTPEQRTELKALCGREVRLERLQEQIWTACIAEALATNELVQDPKPELYHRDPTTGKARGHTDEQEAEMETLLEDEAAERAEAEARPSAGGRSSKPRRGTPPTKAKQLNRGERAEAKVAPPAAAR